MITTQKQLRTAFWEAHQGLQNVTKRKVKNYAGTGTMFNTDTRCAFVDYVDSCERCGLISGELAQRATL